MGKNDADLRDVLACEAEARMREGFHCSEAVLMTMGPYVAQPWIPAYVRLATGFAGGIGGTHDDVCGALAGGVMVLGAAMGRTSVRDDQDLMALVARFRGRFVETCGSTRCETIRTTMIKNEGGLGSCAPFVRQVTAMLYDLLAEAGLLRREP